MERPGPGPLCSQIIRKRCQFTTPPNDPGCHSRQIHWTSHGKEELIHKKIPANDGFLVTPRQAKAIAEQLNACLKGRKLQIDIAKRNTKAKQTNDATLSVSEALDTPERKSAAAHLRRAKLAPVTLDRRLRKVVREFAAFCERSGGFWHD